MTQALSRKEATARRQADTREMIAAINANAERAARERDRAAFVQMLEEQEKERAHQRVCDVLSVITICLMIAAFTAWMWTRTDQLVAAVLG